MANSREDLYAKLKILQDKYSASLPEKMTELELAFKKVQLDYFSEKPLTSLQTLAHRLAGSGATYGFTLLSEKARALDIYLLSLLSNRAAITEVQHSKIRLMLKALQQASLIPDAFSQKLKPNQDNTEERAENHTIFLLESDQHLGEYLALQIGYFGYRVSTFSELSDLVVALEKEQPAAIIMDIIFPKGRLAERQTIRNVQDSRINEVPILFVSSNDDIIARLQAVRIGGMAYFTKPVNVSALVDKLDELTSRQGSQPYNILIVEDDHDMADYLALVLQGQGMVTTVVNDPLHVMQPLAEFVPDLILVDLYMPGCTGLELAAVIRQQEAYLSIPIVFLSSETNPDKQLEAMQLGGDDFLTKPIEEARLISSVSTRAQRSRILRSFMVRDGLTGLLNHTETKGQLSIELARAKRRQAPLAFAMIDLDNFKTVNDTYGHPTGDRVLKNLSRLLQQRLRKTDVIGRYGGEEFAIILIDTDGPTAFEVLDEIRAGFAQILQQSGNVEFSTTFSCGIAVSPNYPDAASLNAAADRALYDAKKSGRNRTILT